MNGPFPPLGPEWEPTIFGKKKGDYITVTLLNQIVLFGVLTDYRVNSDAQPLWLTVRDRTVPATAVAWVKA